jgi:hydrogenase expression/formation protein HypC
MCLGVPGKIVEIKDCEEEINRKGKIDFSGVLKEVSLAYLPEAKLGDYVIVHAGFALSILDEKEASEVFRYLSEMEKAGTDILGEKSEIY